MVPERRIRDSTAVLLRGGTQPPLVFLLPPLLAALVFVSVLAGHLFAWVYFLRESSLDDDSLLNLCTTAESGPRHDLPRTCPCCL